MDWIDESRRSAFERGESIRRKQSAGTAEMNENTRDLEDALSEAIKLRAVAIGNELILSYEDALAAIDIATASEIAVLGFDSGEIHENGFQVLDYTGYDAAVSFSGDWKAYVEVMNLEANRWLEQHRLGKNHGYILTSTSKEEFDELQRWDKKQVFRSTRTRSRS